MSAYIPEPRGRSLANTESSGARGAALVSGKSTPTFLSTPDLNCATLSSLVLPGYPPERPTSNDGGSMMQKRHRSRRYRYGMGAACIGSDLAGRYHHVHGMMTKSAMGERTPPFSHWTLRYKFALSAETETTVPAAKHSVTSPRTDAAHPDRSSTTRHAPCPTTPAPAI